MKADRRAQSARPRGMSLANSLREAKGGACPPFLRSYSKLSVKTFLTHGRNHDTIEFEKQDFVLTSSDSDKVAPV